MTAATLIERDDRDGIATLTLAHGKVNALDVELLVRFREVLHEVGESDARAVVLTGRGSCFSAGVDLLRIVDGGREYIEHFLPALDRALDALYFFPRPVVAAIGGHAIAGGAILAAACDHRIAARTRGRIGVPELLVGVPFPPLALEIVREWLAPRYFSEVIFGGQTFDVEAAHTRGLVDELCAAGELAARAGSWASARGELLPDAFALTKELLRRPVRERVESARALEHDLLESWAAPETLEAIRDYLERTIGRS